MEEFDVKLIDDKDSDTLSIILRPANSCIEFTNYLIQLDRPRNVKAATP